MYPLYNVRTFFDLDRKKNSNVSAGPPGGDFFSFTRPDKYLDISFFYSSPWTPECNSYKSHVHYAWSSLLLIFRQEGLSVLSREIKITITSICSPRIISERNGNAPGWVSIFVPTRPGGNITYFFGFIFPYYRFYHWSEKTKTPYNKARTEKIKHWKPNFEHQKNLWF